MIPIRIVPTMPTPHPALAKAKGPANKPDPKDAFIRFAVDLASLKKGTISLMVKKFMSGLRL